MDRVIGIGEMAISNNSEDTIKTFALASCIGIIAYSASKKVGGMIHIALPNPNSFEAGESRPYYYAATGIPMFINKIYEGYKCDREELKIHIYGGARSIRADDYFNIGEKNINIATNILKSMKLDFDITDVGGTVSRTIELNLSNGQVKVVYLPIVI